MVKSGDHDNRFVFLFDLKPRQKTDPFKGLKFDDLSVLSPENWKGGATV